LVALEVAISKILIDVATSTAVDVVTKRSINPILRGAGRAYKVYSLIEPSVGIYNAIRISAYSDAFGIAAHEMMVKLASNELSKRFISINGANFEIHKKAERYLLEPEFSEALSQVGNPLRKWSYDPDFVGQDYTELGRPLIDQTLLCIERAVRANLIANELLNHAESKEVRRYRRWDRPASWVDSANTQMGYIFWRPIPEIGLGQMQLSNSRSYRGIFRRNTAEGYGRIEWSNGNKYFGQVDDGDALGYGVFHFANGAIYIGHIPIFWCRLGVSVTPQKDSIFYGEHSGGTPNGYGRRVGLSNGIGSVTGFWIDGQISSVIETMGDTYEKISKQMQGSIFTKRLIVEYNDKSTKANAALSKNDSIIVSTIKPFL